MSRQEIQLFELPLSRYGLVISPMLPSFTPKEHMASAFYPHRHGFYGFFLLETGNISMMVEGNNFTMKASSILLVQPGQIHQCIKSEAIGGWVMFFDGKFLDTKTRAVIEKSTNDIALFDLNLRELIFIKQILSCIYQTAEDKTPEFFQPQMLHAMINTLFYKAANMHLLRRLTVNNSNSRPGQIVQEFKNLIKANFRTYKRPADYAGLLHISVTHLNDTLKAYSGYSTTALLQQEVIGEAIKQLRYTSKTVKEIAYELGFTDQKYFTRLFSKHAGMPPSAVRKTTEQPAAYEDEIKAY